MLRLFRRNLWLLAMRTTPELTTIFRIRNTIRELGILGGTHGRYQFRTPFPEMSRNGHRVKVPIQWSITIRG